MSTLPAGTKIICPRKGHPIGTLNADMPLSDLRPKYVDFDNGQERVAGESPICQTCGSAYIVQGKIHTSEGWKPADPQLEPVAPNNNNR